MKPKTASVVDNIVFCVLLGLVIVLMLLGICMLIDMTFNFLECVR